MEIMTRPMADDALIQNATRTACELLKGNLDVFAHAFKYSNSEKGFYEATDNVEWTTGFWTGQLWLAWQLTGDDAFRSAAEWQVSSFKKRIEERIDVDHHDMGFLYSPSCVAAYRLTGSSEGRQAAIKAADNLISRFREKGQFIQAWGSLDNPNEYRLIIDCLLNLPLLFWASETTGDGKYRDIALRHFNTAISCVLRPDDSTYHTYYFDPETGLPLRGVTRQGNRDGSAWARGQAWGVYGSAIAYRYAKDEKALDVFHRALGYFLGHLPEDLIPYWDFDFDIPSTQPRDSSASAIAICGMLEMADILGGEEGEKLKKLSRILIKPLIESCAVTDPSTSNGLLLHGTYCQFSEWNNCASRGVDECNIWGDYYYLEALSRLKGGWQTWW